MSCVLCKLLVFLLVVLFSLHWHFVCIDHYISITPPTVVTFIGLLGKESSSGNAVVSSIQLSMCVKLELPKYALNCTS